MLYALVERELSADELAREAGLGANAVSPQLRALRHLRVVVARRDGRRMLDSLHDGHLVDRSVVRSRAGLRGVGASLVVLLLTGLAQIGVFVATGSVASTTSATR